VKYLAVSEKQATTESAPHRERGGPGKKSLFYVGAAIFVILLSMIGFGPSIIDQSRRNAPSTLLVIAHGIAVGRWLLLFLTQAILVATGRTAVHRAFLEHPAECPSCRRKILEETFIEPNYPAISDVKPENTVSSFLLRRRMHI